MSYMELYRETMRENATDIPSPAHAVNAPAKIDSAGRELQVSDRLASRINRSFGLDASRLRLRESGDVAHTGAYANTRGNTISFAPGRFSPETDDGMRLLGHELQHVVQQSRGDVREASGGLYSEDRTEADSDSAGEAFASGNLTASGPVSVPSSQSGPVQEMNPFKAIKRKIKNRKRERAYRKNEKEGGFLSSAWRDKIQLEDDRGAETDPDYLREDIDLTRGYSTDFRNYWDFD